MSQVSLMSKINDNKKKKPASANVQHPECHKWAKRESGIFFTFKSNVGKDNLANDRDCEVVHKGKVIVEPNT